MTYAIPSVMAYSTYRCPASVYRYVCYVLYVSCVLFGLLRLGFWVSFYCLLPLAESGHPEMRTPFAIPLI